MLRRVVVVRAIDISIAVRTHQARILVSLLVDDLFDLGAVEAHDEARLPFEAIAVEINVLLLVANARAEEVELEVGLTQPGKRPFVQHGLGAG